MKRERDVEAGRRATAHAEVSALAAQAALSLLARSIMFGHKRLAIIRLAMAVQADAEIPPASWLYCREIASHGRDDRLRSLFIEATGAAANRCAGSASLQ